MKQSIIRVGAVVVIGTTILLLSGLLYVEHDGRVKAEKLVIAQDQVIDGYEKLEYKK